MDDLEMRLACIHAAISAQVPAISVVEAAADFYAFVTNAPANAEPSVRSADTVTTTDFSRAQAT